jgi:hypothetical protein
MKHPRILPFLLLTIAGIGSAHASTTKPVWEETSECAVSTSLPSYGGQPVKCFVINKSGTINTYQEYQEFNTSSQFIAVSMAVAGYNTVWRNSNIKSIMAAMRGWLDKQDAKFTKAKERTLPIRLWVKRAKHYDLTMKDYGDECFAFTSVGGGGSGKSAYQLGVVVCNYDKSPIGLEERRAISNSISIKHKLYKEPRSTF